jgi:PncC family amidohydrolase
MAQGARARIGTDLAVSVTGIAGPDGGTTTKPVGLTYIAVATTAGVEVRRHLFQGDRDANRRAAAAEALTRLVEVAQDADRPR